MNDDELRKMFGKEWVLKKTVAALGAATILAGCSGADSISAPTVTVTETATETVSVTDTDFVTVTATRAVFPPEKQYGPDGDIQSKYYVEGLTGTIDRCYVNESGVVVKYTVDSRLEPSAQISGTVHVKNYDGDSLGRAGVFLPDSSPGEASGTAFIYGIPKEEFICEFINLEAFAVDDNGDIKSWKEHHDG